MKLGVFVGSFNPVHKGHIRIVNYILKNKYVDKVLIIPTPNYWNKKDIIDVKHRIKMLENYETDNIIIERKLINLPYTYQVIRELKKKYKEDELFLIMGADNIVSFDEWKHYKELLSLGLIIYKRDNLNVNYYLDKLNKKDNFIVIDNVDNINISSTKIRESINRKEVLEEMLDKKVLDYIMENNLYK